MQTLLHLGWLSHFAVCFFRRDGQRAHPYGVGVAPAALAFKPLSGTPSMAGFRRFPPRRVTFEKRKGNPNAFASLFGPAGGCATLLFAPSGRPARGRIPAPLAFTRHPCRSTRLQAQTAKPKKGINSNSISCASSMRFFMQSSIAQSAGLLYRPSLALSLIHI